MLAYTITRHDAVAGFTPCLTIQFYDPANHSVSHSLLVEHDDQTGWTVRDSCDHSLDNESALHALRSFVQRSYKSNWGEGHCRVMREIVLPSIRYWESALISDIACCAL